MFLRLESITELNNKLYTPLCIYNPVIKNYKKDIYINNNNKSIDYSHNSSTSKKNLEKLELMPYVLCEYNRVEESFRSPYTNEYIPKVTNGKYPPKELRNFEIDFGKLFSKYACIYYNNKAVSSVYCWELGDSIQSGFGVCASIVSQNKENILNSTNILSIKFSSEEIKKESHLKVHYKLDTTFSVYLKLKDKDSNYKSSYISSNLSKQVEDSCYITNYLDYNVHFKRIGRLIELNENYLRNELEEIYIKKPKYIVSKLKSNDDYNNRESLIENLIYERKINYNTITNNTLNNK